MRNLVGTAVEVGVARAPPSRIRELIQARGRYRGVRAPAWGLTLVRVSYPPGLRADQVDEASSAVGTSPYFTSRSDTASRR